MKRIAILVLVCFFSYLNVKSQENNSSDSLPPYLKYKHIPNFMITTGKDSVFTKENLPSKRPVVILYFDPECGHCQLMTKDLTDSMKLVDKAFFVYVMSYYKKFSLLEQFRTEYKINQFSNIISGKENKYNIPLFFQIKFLPFLAVYDAKGNLKEVIRKDFSVLRLKQILEE